VHQVILRDFEAFDGMSHMAYRMMLAMWDIPLYLDEECSG